MTQRPSRGDVWTFNPDPTKGREQSGYRPALIISVDKFNHGPADLLIVMPLTTTDRGLISHVAIEPPMGGVERTSYIMTEQVRSISKDRVIDYWGSVDARVMAEVGYALAILTGL
jgi:mRNA interferase MazF